MAAPRSLLSRQPEPRQPQPRSKAICVLSVGLYLYGSFSLASVNDKWLSQRSPKAYCVYRMP